MFERFDLLSIALAHFRAISYENADGKHRQHWPTVTFLALGTLAAAVVTWFAGGVLKNATAFLSASALASGVLLAVFAQLATLRSRVTEEQSDLGDAIDEGVAHVLMAEVLTLIATGVIALGLMLSDDSSVRGPFSIIAVALLTYTVLTIIMLLPNLLWAYTNSNKVRRELNGFRR